MRGYAEAYIISKLFAKENTDNRFGPVDTGPGVQVAEIMSGAGTEANLAFLAYTFPLSIHGGSTQQAAYHGKG